jgi:DNA invertase Pin-like site-specific DNA recombinase
MLDMRVISYARVSSVGQAESGLGLAAQRHAIEQEVARRGWEVVQFAEDAGLSGKDLAGRPTLADALTALDAGQADVLITAKLDRLSRSTRDLAILLERAKRHGWAVVALDTPVDTSTPMGEAMVGVVAVFAQLERRLIAERTRVALAEKKRGGARLGRPRALDSAVEALIVELRHRGAGLTAIAEQLNEQGVATARSGRRWYASTVRAVLQSVALDVEARAAAAAV